jgi:hypothetical protein
MVREIREKHRLSRKQFSELVGWDTTARLGNIETKDSWKAGNREHLAQVLNQLEAGELVTSLPADAPAPAKRGRPPKSASIPKATNGEHPTYETYTTASEFVTIDLDPDDVAPAMHDHELDLAYVIVPEDFMLQEPQFTNLGTPVPTVQLPKQLPLTPVDHTFSNSEFASWKQCRRKWWLAWYRKLSLKRDDRTSARAIGDRVHRALAAWYVPDGVQKVDPRDALERVIVEDWTAIATSAREANADEEMLAQLAVTFDKAVSLERIMVEGYWEWLKDTGADSDYKIVGSEQVVYADIDLPYDDGDPTAAKSMTRPVRIIGRIDARFQRKSDGALLFDDHKTAADMTGAQKTLSGDAQMLTYHLLDWLNTADSEARCDGALYTMLKKVKRTQKATPPFYERIEVRHSDLELESFKHELIGAMQDILRTEEALNAGANPLEVAYRSWDSTCAWKCDFYPICGMFNDGSRVEDAIAGLYVEGDPRARYDSAEVAQVAAVQSVSEVTHG